MKFHVLNGKLIVGGIFCDLAKACDCVNHETLLDKLNFNGITGKVYELIKSYCRDRYQRVEIKNPIVHIQTGEL
jgi:hypothetical protein